MRWEIGGLVVVVVLVTAVLVNLQPAREAAGVTGVFSIHEQIADGTHVNLVVDPNRAGANQIHLYLLTETGRPADLAEAVTFELSKPDADIGPLTRTPEVAGPGHWILTGPCPPIHRHLVDRHRAGCSRIPRLPPARHRNDVTLGPLRTNSATPSQAHVGGIVLSQIGLLSCLMGYRASL